MELIIFLIDHYYLSLPLIVTIILLIYATSKKGGTKISPQNLVALSNNENGFIVDLRDSEPVSYTHLTLPTIE